MNEKTPHEIIRHNTTRCRQQKIFLHYMHMNLGKSLQHDKTRYDMVIIIYESKGRGFESPRARQAKSLAIQAIARFFFWLQVFFQNNNLSKPHTKPHTPTKKRRFRAAWIGLVLLVFASSCWYFGLYLLPYSFFMFRLMVAWLPIRKP